MKKKSFIPYLIIATFVLFAIYIGQFVYRSMQRNLNLVSKDYYELEIKHQDKIDLRARSIEENKKTIIKPVENRLEVSFDDTKKIKKAQISFFRPSNDKLDWNVTLELNSSNETAINTSVLKRGAWKIKLTYQIGDQTYLKEQDLHLK